jgi:hypothetical protein
MRGALVLVCLVALAGCGGDDAPPDEAFPPLHYEFLKQLRLNVGSVAVQVNVPPPAPDDVTAQDPAPPGEVLAQMARDRLFAAGTIGHAVFTVDLADINQTGNGTLNGELAGHLQVLNDAGQQMAFAEARVSRQHVPGSDPENLHNNLYDMTRQMMDAMNVELEYQIRRSMRSWLVTNTAVPAPVIAEPLAPAAPVTPPVPAPETGTTIPPYPMPNQSESPDMSPPMQMSPPPGYLQPPGATPP